MAAPDRLAIVNGHVVDPAANIDRQTTVLIENGVVHAIGENLAINGARIIDATGLTLFPGLIDLHVHLREPGFTEKETIATGSRAAAAGGFTTVCCMPNTNPALDSVETLRGLIDIIERDAAVRVLPIATISRDRAGAEPVDYRALAEIGAIGFSDDGDTTLDPDVMRAALAASVELDVPVMVHCEDKSLALGAMHKGAVSERLGISGIDPLAEEKIIARDLDLAEETGGWLHVLHVSTARGAELVTSAKSRGLRVTAEVMPHHLTMTDEWVAGDRTLVNCLEPPGPRGIPADPNTKVNPPLRTYEDTVGLLRALQQGTFDVVATDHAPHAAPEKEGASFEDAAFGMNGSELALPLMLALVRAGHFTLEDLVRWMSLNPAQLLKVDRGTLTPGSPADLTLVDLDQRWTATREALQSKSANTPLLGMDVQGKVKMTLVDGVPVYED